MTTTEIARHGARRIAVEIADTAFRHAEDRLVYELRVIAVGFVFDEEFPVGACLMLEKAGGDLDLALW